METKKEKPKVRLKRATVAILGNVRAASEGFPSTITTSGTTCKETV